MERAIFYKEWIKTRYYYMLALAVSWGCVGYTLLKIRYIMNDLFFAAMTLLVAASSLVPSSGSEAQPEALPVHDGSE